ncbi:uncharacterized protein LOC144453129 [Glandiceps talaboti]
MSIMPPFIVDHDYCTSTGNSKNQPSDDIHVEKAISMLIKYDVLEKTDGFEALTTACIRKKLSDTPGYKSGVPIKFKTGGQPLCLTYTPQSRKGSSDATDRTKAARAMVNKLTHHDDTLPENEIIVKVGGDKGVGTTKSVFQVCNVEKPNSAKNTIVFNVFKASDSEPNMRTAMKVNDGQVDALDGHVWRDKTIVVHIMGDYEYLTRMYGLSGASGKYFCLWCYITKSDAMIPPDQKAPNQSRSLHDIQEYHDKLVEAGAHRSKASEFMNCINKPYFNIPLEREFAKLDVKVFTYQQHTSGDIDEPVLKPVHFDLYAESIQRAFSLEDEVSELKDKATAMQERVQAILMNDDNSGSDSDDDNEPSLAQLCRLERQIKQNLAAAKEKPEVIRSLFSAVSSCVENVCPDLLSDAEAIRATYQPLLLLFGECHNLYSVSRVLTDTEIVKLGESVQALMVYYRQQFPTSSVFPK